MQDTCWRFYPSLVYVTVVLERIYRNGAVRLYINLTELWFLEKILLNLKKGFIVGC